MIGGRPTWTAWASASSWLQAWPCRGSLVASSLFRPGQIETASPSETTGGADTDLEVARVVDLVAAEGVAAFPATHFADGGVGAQDLAQGVLQALDEPSPYSFSYTYDDDLSLTAKVEAIATRLYGSGLVTWEAKARRRLLRIEDDGYGALPVCVAKTQYSFSTDPTSLGAPSGHELHVREVRLSAGAGFVVVVCGDMMTMPGLPADPSASRIDLADDGTILGLS